MANDKGKPEGAPRADQGAQPAKSTVGPVGSEAKTAARVEARIDDATNMGLEQIREILFGAVYRELDRRLIRADAHLATSTKDLEQEARRRTEVLETHLKREVQALAGRIEREFAEIGDALRKTAREQRDAVANVEQKLAKVEETSLQGQRELRNQLLEQAKSFLDQLQRLRKELIAMLQEELGLAEGEPAEELRETEEHPRH
jgi:hypothetical protein